MSPLHPGVIEAAKALSDYADGMRETREMIDSQADELRSRWARQYLANRCATGLSSSTARTVAALRASVPFAENNNG